MNRDPWSGEQLRFDRQLPTDKDPITGPWVGAPQVPRGDLWVVIVTLVVTVLIVTSEWLGWPMP